MGEVFEAEDTKLLRKVALKLLPASVAADPERRERFEREARAVAALNHPNIVTIYSVEEAGGTPFLTMELVEGRTLGEAIPDKGLSGNSISRALVAIKMFYKFLAQERFIKDDVASILESPKLIRPLPNVLNTAEVEKLLQAPDKGEWMGIRRPACAGRS